MTVKKLLTISCALALAACTQTAETSNAGLTACLTQKAYNTLSDGSLANSEVLPLAKKIAGQCLQQLALQKAGLDDEAIMATTTLLSTLKENTTTDTTTK